MLGASCIKKMITPATYSAFVGCFKHPISDKYPGTANWSIDLAFPGWAQFTAFVMVTAPIVFIPVLGVVNWKSPVTRIPELEETQQGAGDIVIVNKSQLDTVQIPMSDV